MAYVMLFKYVWTRTGIFVLFLKFLSSGKARTFPEGCHRRHRENGRSGQDDFLTGGGKQRRVRPTKIKVLLRLTVFCDS